MHTEAGPGGSVFGGGRCLFYTEVLGLGTSFARLGPAATACGPKLCLHRATPTPLRLPELGLAKPRGWFHYQELLHGPGDALGSEKG